MRHADAVFFDAGLTLLVPVRSVEEVYLEAARSVGASLEEDAFREHLTALWKRVLDYRSAEKDLETSEALERDAWRRFTLEAARPFPALVARHSDWLALLVDHFDSANAWALAPGAKTLLGALRTRGVRLGVVSNWPSALHGIGAGLGLDRLVDFVLTSAEAGRKKPHRGIFEQALARAGVAPEKTLHVGDSWRDDVEGAIACGLSAVFVSKQLPPVDDPRVLRVASLEELEA